MGASYSDREDAAGTIRTNGKPSTADCRLLRGADFVPVALRAAAGTGIRFVDLRRRRRRAEGSPGAANAPGDDQFDWIHPGVQHRVRDPWRDLDRNWPGRGAL